MRTSMIRLNLVACRLPPRLLAVLEDAEERLPGGLLLLRHVQGLLLVLLVIIITGIGKWDQPTE